jgi:glutamate synthase domain-containing protein 3
MGSLEQMPTGDVSRSIEAQVSQEVLEMDKNLVSGAKVIFESNHELVKEAMFGMGSRKAKEVMEQLAGCREETKKIMIRFRKAKAECFPTN